MGLETTRLGFTKAWVTREIISGILKMLSNFK